MTKNLKQFEFKNIYEFYKSLHPKDKRQLRLKMRKFCRMLSDQQIKNWFSQESIPFTQSENATKAVKKFAAVTGMELGHITEKILFPDYSELIEEFAITELDVEYF